MNCLESVKRFNILVQRVNILSEILSIGQQPNGSNYFQTGSGPVSLLSRNPSSLYMSHIIKKLLFAYAKTNAQISCAITDFTT